MANSKDPLTVWFLCVAGAGVGVISIASEVVGDGLVGAEVLGTGAGIGTGVLESTFGIGVGSAATEVGLGVGAAVAADPFSGRPLSRGVVMPIGHGYQYSRVCAVNKCVVSSAMVYAYTRLIPPAEET